jgi:protein gp37
MAENVKCHPDRLRQPYKLKTPSRVFVNSMSDLFHECIPDAFIMDVFGVMADLPQHTFQVLTKRPERAACWNFWPDNVWMGTSVEDARVTHRIDTIQRCRAKIKFLSCEPLIGPLGDVDFRGIDWVIVGGESGPGYRPMHQQWCRQIRDICLRDGAAFFFKQDAAFHTETRPYLQEESGECFEWRQFPGELTPPNRVLPPNRP